MKTLNLTGHAALVTGSTKGIGAAIADGLTEAGAVVLRHGSSKQSAQVPGVLIHNMLEPDAPAALIHEAFQRNPDLDLLVCNAGSFFDVPFLKMQREHFEKTMRLNVEQAYFVIQKFSERLIEKQRPGAVVIISSTNGFMAEEDSTAYDVSKGALVMMTRTLAMALAPHGIRVNGVAPGLIRTPLTSGWMDAKPEMVRHYEKKILLGRIGSSEDCAGACVFLCSDAAQYVVGQTIVIDGGLTTGQIGRFEQ